jgi:cbb3-type cytochrome oxidase subunit 3
MKMLVADLLFFMMIVFMIVFILGVFYIMIKPKNKTE